MGDNRLFDRCEGRSDIGLRGVGGLLANFRKLIDSIGGGGHSGLHKRDCGLGSSGSTLGRCIDNADYLFVHFCGMSFCNFLDLGVRLGEYLIHALGVSNSLRGTWSGRPDCSDNASCTSLTDVNDFALLTLSSTNSRVAATCRSNKALVLSSCTLATLTKLLIASAVTQQTGRGIEHL